MLNEMMDWGATINDILKETGVKSSEIWED